MGRVIDVKINSITQVHTPVMDRYGNIVMMIEIIEDEEEKDNG